MDRGVLEVAQPNELDRVKDQVLAQIQSFIMDIEDPTLRQEAERALNSLKDYEGDPQQFLTDANEILSNLVRLVGESDNRSSELRALYADLDEIQQAAATPEGLVEILGCLDYPEARQVAIELIQTTSLLTQLSRGVFIGENGEKIRDQARIVFRDLLSSERGQFHTDIAMLYSLGAAKILRAIRRDPTGYELRQMIQTEQISYSEIVSIAKRIVDAIRKEVLSPLLHETERELNEGLISYLVPREARLPDDPIIVKLASYIDPQTLIRSRLATPLERTLKRKSVPIFGELLQLSDDLTRLLSLLYTRLLPSDQKSLSKAINPIRHVVREFQETSSVLDLIELENEVETENRFLLLFLRKEFLSELRKRVSLVYGDLSEGMPLTKATRKFFEQEVVDYISEFTKIVNENSLKELQTVLSAWRYWLHRIEMKYQINEIQMRRFLKFAPDNFITIEQIIQHPKHLLKLIPVLKRRKRLVAIERRGNDYETVINRLDLLFEYLNRRLN